LIRIPSYDTFHLFVRLLTIPSPPFAASFLLFQGQTLVHHGAMRDSSRPRALFAAVCQGLTYAPLSNHVRIFLPDLSLSNYLFRLHKHSFLDLSRSFTLLLSNFLSADPMHHVDVFRYSIKWPGLPGMARIDSLSEEQQRIVFPLPPLPLQTPKPVSFTLSKINTIFFAVIVAFGNPSSGLTANLLLSILAPFIAKTAARPLLRSNLPLTTHSHTLTPKSSALTLATPSGAHATAPPYPLPFPRHSWNKPVSTASWQYNTPTHDQPFPLIPPEHPFPVPSGLVRVDGGTPCGLVQGPATRTRHITSCLNAHPFLHLAVRSSDPSPLTLMSSGPLTAVSNSANSNVPPTVSFALCPPDPP